MNELRFEAENTLFASKCSIFHVITLVFRRT